MANQKTNDHQTNGSDIAQRKAAIGNNEPRRMMEGDPIIARLEARKEQFEFAGDTLRNQASFFLVVNPDELSIRETRRGIEGLRDYGLDVQGMVVNKLSPEPGPDEEGTGAQFLRQRVETERERLQELHDTFDVPVVAEIQLRIAEIKGNFLDEVAAELNIEVTAEADAH